MTNKPSQTPPAPPSPKGGVAEAVPPVAPLSKWDRLVEDVQRRPRAWFSIALTAACVLALGFVAMRYFSDQSAQKVIAEHDRHSKALNEPEPKNKAARLDELRKDVAGKP